MEDFYGWSGVVGAVVAIPGTIFAILAWSKSRQVEKFLEKEKARLNEKITLILNDGNNEQKLPHLRRQDITRGEIQGRLGAIPMKKKGARYAIQFLPEFYEQIDLISEGTNEKGRSTLTITCTPEEFSQFDFEPVHPSATRSIKPEAEPKTEKTAKPRVRNTKSAK